MAKILCVLYDDPAGGYPTSYPRDAVRQYLNYGAMYDASLSSR